MPELEELDMQPNVWGSRDEDTLHPLNLLPESFQSLLFLKFTRGNKETKAELFRAPILTHLTKLVVEIDTGAQNDITTRQLFALLVAHSPGLQEFECTGSFHLDDSNITSLYSLAFRSLKLSGSYFPGPELSMSTLSGLSPTLKVLELNYYVSSKTIMLLPLRLLRLEFLRVCLNLYTIPNAIDTSHLSGASLEGVRAIWLSHPFTLIVRCDQWAELEPAKLDICAKIFAMAWPFMNLDLHDPNDVSGRASHAPLFEKKVAEYSELVLQNGRLG
ncbi:hypothetical protein BDV93DRAFT_193766 [Ceratobasidium sp. AG-I]|nr:hypothetical protein BDV93DRAFT_193766 [Ceratobasidium sp. AG-I]